jgi:hypothetical protein
MLQSRLTRGVAFLAFEISKLGTRPQGGESEGQYRTRNFEQQKFLKGIRPCFSLRYSAVSCSAVLLFIFSTPGWKMMGVVITIVEMAV